MRMTRSTVLEVPREDVRTAWAKGLGGRIVVYKQNRYVEAAEALGCRHLHILVTHILPNVPPTSGGSATR